MDINEFLEGINRPGAFQRVEWDSEVKGAAAHKDRVLTKRVAATVRTGIKFENLAVNADRRDEIGKLPFGRWKSYPNVIENDEGTRDYARLYVVDNTVRSAYFVDGKEVTKDEFDQYLTPSARKSKRSTGGTITVKLENLRFVA